MRFLVLPVLCISLTVAEAGDSQKPLESRSQAELTAEIQRLRKEVEALNARIERLQRTIGGDDSAPQPDGPAEENRPLGDIQAILARFNNDKATVWQQSHGKIRELRLQTAASLKEVQDHFTREAKLDEAVAIRDAIRSLKEGGRKALSDPGALRVAGAKTRTLFFRVTGANQGSIWGTDVYTSDSWLATAAVHAGVLKLGQTGIVKVTTIPSHAEFVGSTRHGITSYPYGAYAGFRVEPLSDEDEEYADDEANGITLSADESTRPRTPPPAGADLFDGEPYPESTYRPAAGLPAEARPPIDRFEVAATEIRKEARQKVARLGREAIAQLTPLQEAHTRAGRLDEAIAVRDLIRKLAASVGVTPNPR